MPRIVLVSCELTEEQAAKFPAGVLTWDARVVISTEGDCFHQKWFGWEQGMMSIWDHLETEGFVQRHAPECQYEAAKRAKAEQAERTVEPKW